MKSGPRSSLAGAAKIDITPPIGIDLGGYRKRSGPSTAIHDDLQAAALYLESGEPFLLITADLIGLDRSTVKEIRTRISQRIPLSPGQIMLACSHTHSGPAMPCLPFLGKTNPEYLEGLKNNLVKVASEAWALRAPAIWSPARSPVAIGINRREVKRDLRTTGLKSTGTIAPYVDALHVIDSKGRKMAIWICHAAHPVTLRETNLSISADWCGFTRRALEEAHPGMVALVAQGCSGDVISWPQGNFEAAWQQGQSVAYAVLKDTEAVDGPIPTTLVSASEVVSLPVFGLSDRGEAEALIAQYRQERETRWARSSYGDRLMLDGHVEWAKKICKQVQSSGTGRSLEFEVQVVGLGDFAIVGLSGEVFVEYALSIDQNSCFGQTAVAGCANGVVGYIPTSKAHSEGGYEVDNAIRSYGTLKLKPEVEDIVRNTTQAMLEQVGS